ncbi:unnamed protein product [Merluccius merluccius]
MPVLKASPPTRPVDRPESTQETGDQMWEDRLGGAEAKAAGGGGLSLASVFGGPGERDFSPAAAEILG